MQTEIYEADPFSGSPGAHLATLESDYRFERNDELVLTIKGQPLKLRITFVRLELSDGVLRRQLLGMRL
jgi:hypothetical protein